VGRLGLYGLLGGGLPARVEEGMKKGWGVGFLSGTKGGWRGLAVCSTPGWKPGAPLGDGGRLGMGSRGWGSVGDGVEGMGVDWGWGLQWRGWKAGASPGLRVAGFQPRGCVAPDAGAEGA